MAIILEANPPIIDAKIVTRRNAKDERLASAGIFKTGFRGIVIYRPRPGHSVTLRRARVIARASGRFCRHLSYYLVGQDEAGLVIEVFLGLVRQARNAVFRLRLALQRGALKLAAKLLSSGLSVGQRLAIVL